MWPSPLLVKTGSMWAPSRISFVHEALGYFMISTSRSHFGARIFMNTSTMFTNGLLGIACYSYLSTTHAKSGQPMSGKVPSLARFARKKNILPVRFDDTEIPGLRATIAYIDTRFTTPEELVDLILQKIQRPLVQAGSITSPVDIPRNAEERRQLLTRRPVDWEYYFSPGSLRRGRMPLNQSGEIISFATSARLDPY
jgi:hypothetical protein